MNMTHLLNTPLCRRALVLSALALTLAGCANKNYVVLLPDDDGKLGRVVLSSPKGETLLSNKNQGATLGGTAGETYVVSAEQLKKDFGAALAASPQKPASYLLYFQAGAAALTAESQASLPTILEDIKGRPGADISVIGHSDTLGDAQANYQLGLIRAQSVAQLIGNSNLSADHVSVESHGEKNLLVPTPDETDEPRNRRVEVTVR
jgi:outer membrane protein OmpA-like peptidoglycan-associated protein